MRAQRSRSTRSGSTCGCGSEEAEMEMQTTSRLRGGRRRPGRRPATMKTPINTGALHAAARVSELHFDRIMQK